MDIKTIGLELEKIIPKEKIRYNEPMSKHTTFKTGGKADIFIETDTNQQILSLTNILNGKNIHMHIIGNGSNTLFTDKGFRGIVIKINIKKIEIQEIENEKVVVTVGAGNKLMELGQTLKKMSIKGFEEISGIPGTIGGALKMNAGAYGKEMKDIVIETKCIDKNGHTLTLTNTNQQFEYRKSLFSNNQYIILETKLLLEKGNTEEIQNKMNKYLISRKENQPLEYPSAGSTFKRENGIITAKLIDEAGLKGYSIGGAQISEKHAGFIINKGNATSKDIIELIDFVKKKIYEKYNIKIKEEIEIIGEI